MSDIKLLGLVGVKRVGKDSVAQFLGGQINRIGLADFLKDACSSVFKIPRRHFDEDDKKEARFDIPLILTRESISRLRDIYSVVVPGFWDKANRAEHIISGRLMYSPRHVAQIVGTDYLRKFQEDIHLQVVKNNMVTDKLNVITDVRFLNELEFVRSLGGVTAYVSRESKELEASHSAHISERGVLDLRFKCDYFIDNNKDLDTLHLMVKEFLKVSNILGDKSV
jgi:hypothetical protein